MAHGVVEQVDEHAQERRVVAVERQWRGRRDDGDAGVDGVGGLVRERHGVELLQRQFGSRVFEPAEREEVADEPVQQRRLVLRAAELVGAADAVLDRLQRAAEREQRRAEIVGDRADEEASLPLGGVLLGERAAQAVGHPLQRRADLGDLARARVDGRNVQLATGDPLGIGRQPRQRRDDPAAQQHDAGDQRERERHKPGRACRREAHGAAGVLDEQRSYDRPVRQVVHLVARGELAFAVLPRHRGGQRRGDESAGLRHQRGLGDRAVRREFNDAGLPDRNVLLLHAQQLQVGLGRQRGKRAQQGALGAGVPEMLSGLLDQRGRFAHPPVDVGLLARTDRPPRCPGGQRRCGDGQREPECQPDAQRQAAQATSHRPTGGSKRYPTPQTVTSSCGRAGSASSFSRSLRT